LLQQQKRSKTLELKANKPNISKLLTNDSLFTFHNNIRKIDKNALPLT
jgi:hypothetical protein